MIELFLPHQCVICQASSATLCCQPCLTDLPWVPYHCTYCRRAVAHPNTVCKACLISPSAHHYTIPLLYQAPITQIMGAFKLREQEHLCAPLASFFVSRFSNNKPDLIIPVPSHPKRMWERGYNPALLIARQLSRLLAIPLDDRAVCRTQHAPAQRLQKKRERTVNLINAFEVVRLNKGMRIALVDDVVTTGETLRALAHTVEPFAASIEYWAIAESPHLGLK